LQLVQAVVDFVRAHPLLAAALWLIAMLAMDVILGALDGLIRGEFSWDKLPQVLKTKVYKNPFARALLGLLAAAWFARPEGQSIQDLLVGALTAAAALYSLPISRDVVQKVGYILEDLYARLSGAALPARV
jgi:hypothetical protein